MDFVALIAAGVALVIALLATYVAVSALRQLNKIREETRLTQEEKEEQGVRQSLKEEGFSDEEIADALRATKTSHE